MAPIAGSFPYHEMTRVNFGSFEVNAAGGNLIHRRVDYSIDTLLGTYELAHTFNSAVGRWRWSHDLRYDGATFIDASDAAYDVSALPDGARIPGTQWLRLDASTLKTRGGLVHRFQAGKLWAIHWSSSEYPRLLVSASGIDQCWDASTCNPVFSFTTDAEGRISQIDDRAGRHAEYIYGGPLGLLVQALDPFSFDNALAGTRYQYNLLWRKQLDAIVSPDGERVEFAYSRGRVTEVREIGEQNPVTRFRYERDPVTDENWTTVTNPLGAASQFRFDNEGRIASLHDAVGDLRRWQWQGFDVASEVDAAGRVTSFQYGVDSVTETTPAGNVVTTIFAADGVNRENPFRPALLLRSDSLGVVAERVYDSQGRLVIVRDASGAEESITYHPNQMIASRTLPTGSVFSYDGYGEHGHATTVDRDGSLQYTLWQLYPEYDEVGNLQAGPQIEEIYQPGRPGIMKIVYDARRRPAHMDLAAEFGNESGGSVFLAYTSGSLDIARRSDGKPLSVTRPYGADSQFDYDALGRMLRRRDRVDGVWVDAIVISYDAVGNVRRSERPNGMAQENDYDAVNRPVEQRFLRNEVVEQSVTGITYQAGRLTGWSDSEAGTPETVGYDFAGRAQWLNYARGESLERSFDLRNRETERKYWWPDGSGGQSLLRSIGTEYDPDGRIAKLLDDGVALLEHTWANAQLVQTQYGNGLTRSYAYQPNGLPEGATTIDSGGATVESTAVDRYPASWTIITTWATRTDTFGTTPASSAEYYTLTSNELSLVPETAGGARVWAYGDGSTGSATRFYDYDLLGNVSGHLLLDPGTFDPFTFNAEHTRMLQGAGHSYAYDAAGFVTQRDATAIAWTASGRIASIGADSFRWTASGRPLEQTRAGVTTSYLFGGEVLGDASAQPTAMRLGRSGSEIELALGSNARLYRHFDFRENVSFVTDQTGDVVAHYLYRPYGVADVLLGAGDPVRFGHGEDLGTDLVVLGDRVMDQASGRFLSPDPVWHLMGQYAYTHGNPVWLGDFDGRWDAAGVVAGATAAAAGAALIGVGLVAGPATALGVILIALGLVFVGGGTVYFVLSGL